MRRLLTILFAPLLLGFQSPSETPAPVVRPIWTERPTQRDMERLYPRRVRGVTADVTLKCLIDDAGRFSTCEVVREEPAGRGFGESSLRLSKRFRMKPLDGDGAPVAGRALWLPIRWWAGFGS